MEAIWLEIRCLNRNFLLCVCYRHPDQPVSFCDSLQESIDRAWDTGISYLIVAGDLNADPVKNKTHWNRLQLLSAGNNLSIHINEPTRITPTLSTCLDQFISNFNENVQQTYVLDPIGSFDHCTIGIELKITCTKENLTKGLYGIMAELTLTHFEMT